MIKNSSNYEISILENMRGGDGSVKIENFLTKDELYNKGRLFAKITLEPGASIGYHVHEGEMESYYIISGTAKYDDNGKSVMLNVGDTTLTLNGEGHSIKNVGDTTLEFIALIVFD
ncbi:MAG: cupin domain-containing protein [Oscillospiraceae bacterium]|nr:cupin domain-containing protein [Oscillospiraceae bacterium]